jgi:L-asparaginase
MSDPIRVLVTGGTFDKEYDELSGRLYFKDTHVHEMLRLARCRVDVSVATLFMMDSLEMIEAHRAQVVEACRAAAESRLVVTHGTDTMADTARTLQAAGLAKTVVLTGAMVPYAFGSSDGLFNLGSALSFAQVLPPGVYVAMNGRVFPGDRVRKNRQTGIFEPLP